MATELHPGKQVDPRMRDGDGFDAFVHARLPNLLRFGRALTGSDDAGSDLVQDALERTLMRWSQVAHADPEGYVRRAMVNRSISVWRKRTRERLTSRAPAAVHNDPARDEALFQALRTLPPRQRAVIALRYYEDLTEAQTAAMLGCSVGTVKSHANAAMKKLRILLENSEEN